MKNPKRWVIGDTHFDHINILKYEPRPYADIFEMNEAIIKNWNKKVSKNDIVYMNGDFTLGRNKDRIREIVSQLNGKIVLVMGNHDTLKPSVYVGLGFYTAIRKPIMVEPNIIIMHEPPLFSDVIDGIKYIYAHTHSKKHEVQEYANCFCTSVELNNYEPVNLDELIKKMSFTK